MHLICLQGMSRDFGWMSLARGLPLGEFKEYKYLA